MVGVLIATKTQLMGSLITENKCLENFYYCKTLFGAFYVLKKLQKINSSAKNTFQKSELHRSSDLKRMHQFHNIRMLFIIVREKQLLRIVVLLTQNCVRNAYNHILIAL